MTQRSKIANHKIHKWPVLQRSRQCGAYSSISITSQGMVAAKTCPIISSSNLIRIDQIGIVWLFCFEHETGNQSIGTGVVQPASQIQIPKWAPNTLCPRQRDRPPNLEFIGGLVAKNNNENLLRFQAFRLLQVAPVSFTPKKIWVGSKAPAWTQNSLRRTTWQHAVNWMNCDICGDHFPCRLKSQLHQDVHRNCSHSSTCPQWRLPRNLRIVVPRATWVATLANNLPISTTLDWSHFGVWWHL